MSSNGQLFPSQLSGPPTGNKESLNLPAILLMVSGALGMAYALVSLATSAVNTDQTWMLKLVQDANLREKMAEALAQQQEGSKLLPNLWSFAIFAANALVIYGALQMKNASNYTLAWLAAIIATVPCCFTGCCCITSMPAGIFAIVVLMRPEVKALFQS